MFTGNGICKFLPIKYTLTSQIEASINQVVGQSFRQHQEVFGFTPKPAFHIRIRIFGKYQDYENYTLKDKQTSYIAQHAGSVSNLSGYYSHRTKEVVTWRQKQPSYLANNLLHEASHAIMLGHYRHIPMWISEGCATYFSFPNKIQDAQDIGALKYRWAKLNIWLREDTLPDLKEFLNLDHKSWREEDVRMAYTVSWSLFQHLMSTPQKKRVLQGMMVDLQMRDANCAEIVEKLYPGGIAQLDQDWKRWIKVGGSRVLGAKMEQILTYVRSLK